MNPGNLCYVRRRLSISLALICTFSVSAQAQSPDGRFEAGVFGTVLNEFAPSRVGLEMRVGGLGGRFVHHTLTHLDLEADVAVLPWNSAFSAPTMVQALFGAKVGARLRRIGVFAKARPGFIHSSRDPLGFDEGASTDFSLDVGGVVEVYMSGNWLLRFDAGDTIIWYGTPRVRGIPAAMGGLTTHNLQWSAGVGFRF
jgi:hypothetical protein